MFSKYSLALVVAATIALGAHLTAAGQTEKREVKIGFVVKNAQEPWFLDEWKFADMAAKEKGFTLIKIEARDGEKLLSAIDNLGAQGAQGFIVCVPDVKLGTAVVARAKANGLKLMTVDDRLLGGDGKPLEDVHHMGISALKIGNLVGKAIADEIRARSWNKQDVYAMRISLNELPTAKARTDGATETLLQSGFLSSHIIEAPQKVGTEGAFNAANIAISKSPQVKKWVLFGVNDETVIGGVRALEGQGFGAADIIGVGIGGAESGLSEFRKTEKTGFFGTIVISPKRHGYETATNMYNWIANGVEPPKLVLTDGEMATRSNYQQVLQDLGLA